MMLAPIEMPKHCLACPLSYTFGVDPFYDCYCNLLDRYIDEEHSKERQEDCPLQEVVKCKDCKYRENCCRNLRPNGNSPTDFCSYGEKMEVAYDE